MATNLAKLLQLQVLASPGASPRPRRLVLWRDNHPDTRYCISGPAEIASGPCVPLAPTFR